MAETLNIVIVSSIWPSQVNLKEFNVILESDLSVTEF
jgi:hypothetical protein